MRPMKHALIAALLLPALAAAAGAQDVILLKDGRELQGEVVSLTYKVVEYEPAAAAGVKQKEDSKNIQEIRPEQSRKTFDFVQGENAMGASEFDAAVERFERVRKDARASDLLRQTSAINVVKCFWMKDNIAGALGAIKSLRTERPDTFFLRESYEFEIRCHLAKGDVPSAERAVTELEGKGRSDGMPEYSKTAEVMRAGLFELQKKFREALAIHKKYAKDKDVGEEASLGELRCLKEIADWGGLNGRAESIISEQKGRKVPSYRVLTGAFNARGEFNLNGGKFKEALLDFMQGVAVLSKGGGQSREHETALGRAAFASAKFAAGQQEKAKKQLYKDRAHELLIELERAYGKGPLHAEASKAIAEVK